MDIDEILAQCSGFDWDEGNLLKNWEKHSVLPSECEQVFLNVPFVAAPDPVHSDEEMRFHALGQTDAGRHLLVVFTVRGNLIRVVSARNMSRKERQVYREL